MFSICLQDEEYENADEMDSDDSWETVSDDDDHDEDSNINDQDQAVLNDVECWREGGKMKFNSKALIRCSVVV